jgi:hypothetical protein
VKRWTITRSVYLQKTSGRTFTREPLETAYLGKSWRWRWQAERALKKGLDDGVDRAFIRLTYRHRWPEGLIVILYEVEPA